MNRDSNQFIEIVKGIWANEKKEFMTYKFRPIHQENIAFENNINESSQKHTSLIIQGPIIEEFEFTLNTILLYKRTFENSHLILSTWDDQNTDKFEGHCLIIKSKKPVETGISNINYQIVSTNTGVIKAHELGSEFVLKTRTDQRIYAKEIMSKLICLFRENLFDKQKFIILSFNTFKYRLYSPSDMLMFGKTDDLLEYWDNKLYSEESLKIILSQMPKTEKLIPETFLFLKYLIRQNQEISWDLDSNFKLLYKYFILIDKNMVDLYWPKYSYLEERWLNYNYNSIHEELCFLDNLKYISKPYKISAIIPNDIIQSPVQNIKIK